MAVDGHEICTEGTTIVAAPAGAIGSQGGPGGQGGGGKGGDSYSYYRGNGSTVTVTGAPLFTPGAAGAGGAPTPANVGYSGPTNTAD